MRKSRTRGPAMQYGSQGVGVTSVWLDILQNLTFGLKNARIRAQKPMACDMNLECAAMQSNPSSIIHILEVSVRYTALLVAALALLALVSDTGLSQNFATQSVTVSVSAVAKISVSGNPGALTISDGPIGTDNLTSVSDGSTTYSITHNSPTAKRITASLDAALPAGFTLSASLGSSKGTSAGSATIPAGSAVNLVTGIVRGADAGRAITYTFSALASAGTLASETRTVTLTLTD